VTGRGNALRSGVCPEWQATFPPDQDDFPVLQAAGMFFQRPANPKQDLGATLKPEAVQGWRLPAPS